LVQKPVRALQKLQAQNLQVSRASGAPRVPVVLVVALGVVASILAGAVWAWSHYGTTIFFEMITAGIAACF
jgi:hypothetical protein